MIANHGRWGPYRQASPHRPGTDPAHGLRAQRCASQCTADRTTRGVRPTSKRTRLSVESLGDRCLPSFSPAVSHPADLNPGDIVTADFNNDGRLDLATANADSNSVSVLLGDGQGDFGVATHFAAGPSPHSLVVSDFNNDGETDLAAANDTSTGYGGDVSILLGNGDGAFRPPVSAGGWFGEALSLAPADFNTDGKMDLAYTFLDITDWDAGYVQLLLGDGLGGFMFGGFQSVNSSAPVGVAGADLNADGKADVVTANKDTDTVSVLLGNGDGTLSYDSWFATGYGPDSVAAGDFNGDGQLDLATANYSCVSMLLGNGDGTFQTARSFAAWTPASTTASDVNGDGVLDLVVTNRGTSMSGDGGVSVLLGNGDGSLAQPITTATGEYSTTSVVMADFNGDGRPDAAAANGGSGNVSVLLNDGDWPNQANPRLQIGDVTVMEGNTGTRAATFTVTLSAPSTQTITVAYATGNGTASAGSDYQMTGGTLTFAPGETSKTITVPVIGDRFGEPNETFVVNLSSPTNATIADSQGVGTIMDDEPRVSISDVSKSEGKKGKTTLFTFTVTLSAAYDQPVTLSFRTADGTATTGDGDYVARTGTLTFAPGETTKAITIEVKGDSKKEAAEYFYLDLFDNSSNSLFARSRGVGSIQNDD